MVCYLVDDEQPATAGQIRGRPVASIDAPTATPAVGDGDTQDISVEMDDNGRLGVRVNDGIGDRFTGEQLAAWMSDSHPYVRRTASTNLRAMDGAAVDNRSVRRLISCSVSCTITPLALPLNTPACLAPKRLVYPASRMANRGIEPTSNHDGDVVGEAAVRQFAAACSRSPMSRNPRSPVS